MKKINTKEECLAQVKEDGNNLAWVHIQDFEICKTAVLTNQNEDILKYVDPELRTPELLEAIEIDADEYDEGSFQYINSENYSGSTSEFYTYVEIYGKCSADLLQIAQKQLRRSLEDAKSSWEDGLDRKSAGC